MEHKIFVLFIALLLTGCTANRPQQDDLIVIDVTKPYPEKEFHLEEIANISYVQLDDSDEDFLFRGYVGYITSNYIIAVEPREGNILFFTREGKAKSKFNRRGEGPGEYNNFTKIRYNEKTDELYLDDWSKIRVYTSSGEYKRTLSLPEQTILMGGYTLMDDRSLVVVDRRVETIAIGAYMQGIKPSPPENVEIQADKYLPSTFVRISTTEGNIEESIKVAEDFYGVDMTFLAQTGNRIPGRNTRVVHHKDGLFLHNQETDTVYSYNYDYKLTPYMVQTPSVRDLNPGIYINTLIESGKYQFIELNTLVAEKRGSLVREQLIRDKKTGVISSSKIVFDDFRGKDLIIDNATINRVNPGEGLFEFPAEELHEAYESGRLHGKLKTFVEQMNKKNENNVLMLLHFK